MKWFWEWNDGTIDIKNGMGTVCMLDRWNDETEETNAKRIVNAVNNHKELVETLGTMVAHAKEQYPHFESLRGQKDIQQAEQVLNKAKGV